jgi:hypothetical protein
MALVASRALELRSAMGGKLALMGKLSDAWNVRHLEKVFSEKIRSGRRFDRSSARGRAKP